MAGSISYTRQWSHKDWIDFVDSVQAGGGNGINIRMHGIENEFDAISNVISLIATALQAPAPTSHTLTLPPALSTTGAAPWQQNTGYVSVPTIAGGASFAANAQGFMPLNLPGSVTLQSLRVTGSSSGGFLTVVVNQQPLTGGASVGVLQARQLFPTVTSAALFDIPPVLQNVNLVIDNKTNKYFILVTLSEGNSAIVGGGTSLNAFQITYSA